MTEERIIISGAQIFEREHFVTNKAMVIEKGKITHFFAEEEIANYLPARQLIFSKNDYIVPGFIDLHIHGANGFDVMDGTSEALAEIAKAIAADGVTGFLATTMTAEKSHLESVLSTIPFAQKAHDGAAILGVHLEGPFISAQKCGAQLANLTCVPNLSLVKYWQNIAEKQIKMITLAPELPGAIPFIRALHAMDIIVSIGHTMATDRQTQAAIEVGVSYATHLFNAMRAIHQREPGPSLSLLFSSQVVTELILDEWHLHPLMVELVYRIKPLTNMVLITDAMRAKCLKDGKYELGGQEVSVQNGKVTLANDDTLAGSVLSLPKALKRWMTLTGSSLEESLRLVTENPARVLKLDRHKAKLSVGYDADIAVLNHDLEVQLTMRDGRIIYEKG